MLINKTLSLVVTYPFNHHQKQEVLRILLIGGLVFILLLNAKCQITNVDLLKKNLTVADNDTVRVELLNTLGNHYVNSDSVYSIYYLLQASELAEKIQYTKGLADNSLYTGRFYYYLDNYNESFTAYNKAYELYQQIEDVSGQAEYFFAIGSLYSLLGDYENAIESYQSSIGLRDQLSDKRGIANCLVGLGRIHYFQENHSMALDYFNQAIKVRKIENDQQGIATALSNIGDVYENQGKFELALEYHKSALYIRDSIGEKRRYAISLQNVAEMLAHFGKLDTAAIMYEQAHQIYIALNEKTGRVGNLLRQSRLAIRAKDYEKARQTAEDALMLSEELGNSNFIKNCCRVLHKIFSLKNDYESAYGYLKRYNDIYIQIYSEETRRTIADLEIKYQVAEKDQKISLLNSKNKIQGQRMIILITSLSAILLGLVLVFVILRFKMVSLNQKNVLLEKENEIQFRKVEFREKEKQALSEKLEMQNKELVSKALLMNRTAETVKLNSDELKKIVLRCGNGNRSIQKDIESIIRNFESFTTTNLWDDFELAFINVHSSFYDNLLNACPDLSRTEIKIAALLRLNLTTKEIEAITFKSESGIKSIRYRLRKKLDLDSDQGLNSFLMQL